MKKFITDDLQGDLETLFKETDLYYGSDGNLYSESQEDYAKPLAYVKKIEGRDEEGYFNGVVKYECRINGYISV